MPPLKKSPRPATSCSIPNATWCCWWANSLASAAPSSCPQRHLQASGNPRDAKALATLAYLHNGKLDYPRRILRTMQDPELHALLYSTRKQAPAPLI